MAWCSAPARAPSKTGLPENLRRQPWALSYAYTATYRKVTGGFRSDWGKDLFAAFRSIVGTAERRAIDVYQAVRMTLSGQSVLAPG